MRRKGDQADSNPGQAAAGRAGDDGAIPIPESSMDVTITTLPPVRIAYVRHVGPYGEPVSRFWHEVAMPWLIAAGLDRLPRYGIGRDDPRITDPARCRYDVAVPVPDDFVAQGRVGIETLPGGRYAVAPFEGGVADLERAYTELLRDWLPASGFQADGRPVLEHYPVDARYDPATGRFQCELCVPLARAV